MITASRTRNHRCSRSLWNLAAKLMFRDSALRFREAQGVPKSCETGFSVTGFWHLATFREDDLSGLGSAALALRAALGSHKESAVTRNQFFTPFGAGR